MLIKKIILGLLSFYAVEVKKISLRAYEFYGAETNINLVYDQRKKKEAERRKARPYNNSKWKKKTRYNSKNYKIVGTNPKDVRFANQQKLRRMFRNS